MTDKPPAIPGYVRSGVTHIGAYWQFEVLDAEQEVAIATIETADGQIDIGLNRHDAEQLLSTLVLFLENWPSGKMDS